MRFSTFGVQVFQVVDCELQDFCLFQLGRSLFLEGGRNEAAQFVQARIDAVTPPLLDDPAPPLARHPAAAAAACRARFAHTFTGRREAAEISEK